MAHPKAYDPQQGYMFQLLVKTPYDRAYEHLDYAEDKADRDHLMREYKLAFRQQGYTYKVITLPQKYWKKHVKVGGKDTV